MGAEKNGLKKNTKIVGDQRGQTSNSGGIMESALFFA